jgi:hypothetical protein
MDDPWYCECADPHVDVLGECDWCHRKPRHLMRLPVHPDQLRLINDDSRFAR